jgi:PHD/YefM family antitoxin component YafN of YafNO toxin-antitoxin module
MKSVSISDIGTMFGDSGDTTELSPVAIQRDGKTVAVLVGVRDDEEAERVMLAHAPRLQQILSSSAQSIAEGRGLQHDQFWKQIGEATTPRSPTGNVLSDDQPQNAAARGHFIR